MLLQPQNQILFNSTFLINPNLISIFIISTDGKPYIMANGTIKVIFRTDKR